MWIVYNLRFYSGGKHFSVTLKFNKCEATKRKQEVSSLFRIYAFNVNNQ